MPSAALSEGGTPEVCMTNLNDDIFKALFSSKGIQFKCSSYATLSNGKTTKTYSVIYIHVTMTVVFGGIKIIRKQK